MKTGKKIALAAAVAAGAWLYMDNSRVEVETIPVQIPTLPKRLDGLRIALIADLHLPKCVCSAQRLCHITQRARPDLILMAGDLADRIHPGDDRGLGQAAKGLSKIAPCVTSVGNHEIYWDVPAWKRVLRENGVTVLDNQWGTIGLNGETVALCGLTAGVPLAAAPPAAKIRIALSHYPHFIPDYPKPGFDLVVSGHAHGGQVRVFGRGLFSPGQGIMPKYTSGLYRLDGTQMVVSRGLSRMFPFVRVANTPHLPVIVLKRK